jgi:tetrahydromethanopterin S-methyltransferase subunit A
MNIIAINKAEKEHLEEVKREMLILGAPVLKAVWDESYGAWIALEGSHRIAAAKELNLIPLIEEIKYEYNSDYQEQMDIKDIIEGADVDGTIEDLVDKAYKGPFFSFDED